MTDVQAAIGRAQLACLPRWQGRREEVVARFDKRLSEIGGLALPKPPEEGRSAWHLYVIRVLRIGIARDELIPILAAAGIATSVHFIPTHTMPAYRRLALFPDSGLPNAERVFEQVLSLPLYPLLTDEQVDRICHVLDEEPLEPTVSGGGAGPGEPQFDLWREPTDPAIAPGLTTTLSALALSGPTVGFGVLALPGSTASLDGPGDSGPMAGRDATAQRPS